MEKSNPKTIRENNSQFFFIELEITPVLAKQSIKSQK